MLTPEWQINVFLCLQFAPRCRQGKLQPRNQCRGPLRICIIGSRMAARRPFLVPRGACSNKLLQSEKSTVTMWKVIRLAFKAIVAGLLAMLIFHQGALAGLHYLGETPMTAYDLSPGWPLGLPSLYLLLFWGAVWGLVLWGLIRSAEAAGYYVGAMLLAAVLPSAVYLFIVMPLAGKALAAGGDMHYIAGVLLLHALWGLGVALFMRLFQPPA